jgi:hypothetical protein
LVSGRNPKETGKGCCISATLVSVTPVPAIPAARAKHMGIVEKRLRAPDDNEQTSAASPHVTAVN